MRTIDLRARLTRTLHDLRPGAAPAGRRRTTAALAVAALVGSGMAAAGALTPPPAHDNGTKGLATVGPIDPDNGFPIWYKDTNGVRLELCLDPDDANCIMGDLPHPGQPVSFPDNFPDEAFWSVADATIDAGGGEDALLVTAVEAAFGSADGLPAEKQQISFGRVRVRIGGLLAGSTYKVTHPFGVDTHVAEDAARGINVTEDVGSLAWDGVFDQTLGSRPGPFLSWPSGAPAGYLGDPTVDHVVTGSPYGTNFFRVEGPAGSFTGSGQLCADAALGDSPTATDDCIQTDLFSIQGKRATKIGVQLAKAAYVTDADSNVFLDVWATSEPGQTIVVGGTGFPTTVLRGTAKGEYFARVQVTAVPASFALTNTTDTPDSTVPLKGSDVGDAVHVSSAVYDAGTRTLTVTAASKDPDAVLALNGFEAGGGAGPRTFTVTDVAAPPVNVTVTSSLGGADSDEVVVEGGGFETAAVDAVLAASPDHIAVGETVHLDGSASNAPAGSTVVWTATKTDGGAAVDVSDQIAGDGGLVQDFTPTQPGSYAVSLTLIGAGEGNTDTDAASVTVDPPSTGVTANAGPDQGAVQPLSTVTLSGATSTSGVSYSWAVTGRSGLGADPALTGATTVSPSFVMPLSDGTSKNTPVSVTLTLTVTKSGGTATDTVVVTSRPDALTLTDAQYKAGGAEWRVRGDATYCGTTNLVTVTYNPPTGAAVELGTATPTLAAGVCSWDFRLKNAPAGKRPVNGRDGTVTVTSRLGGELLRQGFTAR